MSNYLILPNMAFQATYISMVDSLIPTYSELQRLQIYEILTDQFCEPFFCIIFLDDWKLSKKIL